MHVQYTIKRRVALLKIRNIEWIDVPLQFVCTCSEWINVPLQFVCTCAELINVPLQFVCTCPEWINVPLQFVCTCPENCPACPTATQRSSWCT